MRIATESNAPPWSPTWTRHSVAYRPAPRPSARREPSRPTDPTVRSPNRVHRPMRTGAVRPSQPATRTPRIAAGAPQWMTSRPRVVMRDRMQPAASPEPCCQPRRRRSALGWQAEPPLARRATNRTTRLASPTSTRRDRGRGRPHQANRQLPTAPPRSTRPSHVASSEHRSSATWTRLRARSSRVHAGTRQRHGCHGCSPRLETRMVPVRGPERLDPGRLDESPCRRTLRVATDGSVPEARAEQTPAVGRPTMDVAPGRSAACRLEDPTEFHPLLLYRRQTECLAARSRATPRTPARWPRGHRHRSGEAERGTDRTRAPYRCPSTRPAPPHRFEPSARTRAGPRRQDDPHRSSRVVPLEKPRAGARPSGRCSTDPTGSTLPRHRASVESRRSNPRVEGRRRSCALGQR